MARRGRIEHNYRLIKPDGGEGNDDAGSEERAPRAVPFVAPAPTAEYGARPAVASTPKAQPPPQQSSGSTPTPATSPSSAAQQPDPPAAPPPLAERFTLLEVAQHLQVSPERLRDWRQRYGRFLSGDAAQASSEWPTFSQADVAVLLTIDSLLGQGYSESQVSESLKPRRIEPPQMAEGGAQLPARSSDVLAQEGALGMGQAIHDVLGTIAGNQQAVLNSQASMREMVSVVVQDNFNLKDENRKLRERMLEMERALAEYQRREETRKERMEARMRAMEGTMAALQQQMAQFVQIQRAQQKRRGIW